MTYGPALDDFFLLASQSPAKVLVRPSNLVVKIYNNVVEYIDCNETVLRIIE